MSLAAICRLIAPELQSLNDTIIRGLESQVEIINQIGHYIVESGGKRIRPLVVLLSSKACHASGDDPIHMAAIVEFIHTATLLHDDVVDSSNLRRGRPTANHVWDNPTAVLVGDFLYSRAFQMMVSLQSLPAMHILAETTNVIAEGEVLQLSHRFQPDVDEKRYRKVIELKTAKLFEAAAQLGALMGQQSSAIEKAMAKYGLHLGTAFQLADDVLDYQATNSTWGKNIGNDLAEGKATLPLIYAMQNSTPMQAQQIRVAIEKGNIGDLALIQETIITSGAIDYTLEAAQQEVQAAQAALTILPDSPYRTALFDLATFAIARTH